METTPTPASAAAATSTPATTTSTDTKAPVLPASFNRSDIFVSLVDHLIRTSTLIDVAGDSGLPVAELGLEWATHLTTMFKTTKDLSVKITRQILPKKDKLTSTHQSLQIRRNQTVVTEYMHLISSLMERTTQTQTFLFDSLPKLLRHAKAMEEAAEAAKKEARKAALDAAIEAAAEAAKKEAAEAATSVPASAATAVTTAAPTVNQAVAITNTAAPSVVTVPAPYPMSCVTSFGPMPTTMSMPEFLMLEELKRLRSLEQTQHAMQLELEKLRAAQSASVPTKAPSASKQGAADGVDVDVLKQRYQTKLANQKRYREKYKRERLESLKNSTQTSEKPQQPQPQQILQPQQAPQPQSQPQQGTTLPLSAPTQSSGYVPVPAKDNVLAHPVPTAAPATSSSHTAATKPSSAGTTSSGEFDMNIDNWVNLHLVPTIHVIPGSDSTNSDKEGASAAKRTKPTV